LSFVFIQKYGNFKKNNIFFFCQIRRRKELNPKQLQRMLQ